MTLSATFRAFWDFLETPGRKAREILFGDFLAVFGPEGLETSVDGRRTKDSRELRDFEKTPFVLTPFSGPDSASFCRYLQSPRCPTPGRTYSRRRVHWVGLELETLHNPWSTPSTLIVTYVQIWFWSIFQNYVRDMIATGIAQCAKYHCWASKVPQAATWCFSSRPILRYPWALQTASSNRVL